MQVLFRFEMVRSVRGNTFLLEITTSIATLLHICVTLYPRDNKKWKRLPQQIPTSVPRENHQIQRCACHFFDFCFPPCVAGDQEGHDTILKSRTVSSPKNSKATDRCAGGT
jgi:hypothetical protein